MIKCIKNNKRFLISFILLVGMIFFLGIPRGETPAIGKLIDPVIGITNGPESVESGTYSGIAGIEKEVSVIYDERGVPHVFAASNEDMYGAQGYVEAQDRYWQMEFLAMSAGGRLSEILGMDYLDYDRTMRRMGIMESAKQSLELIKEDQETYLALQAYTKGVNSYVAQLDEKSYPLEYKLLDYEPQEWTMLNSVLVMKLTAVNLSGYEEDYEMTKLYHELGPVDFEYLFPGDIISPEAIASAEKLLVANNSNNELFPWLASHPGLGSNAWGISGDKTETGNTLFCADPHLSLTYPSFWYEIQLNSPDQNVYGTSIPGVPGIIMGFNNDIAFSTTNGQADVRDWYLMESTADNTAYLLDGENTAYIERIDTINIKGLRRFIDTVKIAIQGPVVYDEGFMLDSNHANMALNWELQKPSNDISTFLKLNKAKNKADFKSAVAGYSCPSQNFLFADRKNQLVLMHQGRIKVNRPGNGQFILNGTKSEFLTNDYISQADLPINENPENGLLFSTNQIPDTVGNKEISYGYYSNVRHRRIKELLNRQKPFNLDEMKAFQGDNLNVFASDILPLLLERLPASNEESAKQNLAALEAWDYQFQADQKAPLIFEIFWGNFEKNLYSKWPEVWVFPDKYRTLELIEAYDTVSFSRHKWSTQKDLSAVIGVAFSETIDSLESLTVDYGEELTWGLVNKIRIGHLTGISVFGDYNLASNGHPNVLNATNKSWGPSWRMIIEIGDEIQGYGVFPGGQSGDPRSINYSANTASWYEQEYFKLEFYSNLEEAAKQATKTLKLVK